MLVTKDTSRSPKFVAICLAVHLMACVANEGLPLFYWHEKFLNFGDHLSLVLVERIVKQPVREYQKSINERKLLAIGSIISFARENDIIWGSGINGKWLDPRHYKFKNLDVRAVRGPLTRDFLLKNCNITAPEIYGDPALLLPYLFPEFKRKKKPTYEFIIIPHYSEQELFPKARFANVVYPTDSWQTVIEKILDSKFVISSSLHGIIVAEAFGIPAQLLRPQREPLFKYKDYYLGTNRAHFTVAETLQQALALGGEPLPRCDLKRLYKSFPFEFWPNVLPLSGQNG